jgi:hypothetical protein
MSSMEYVQPLVEKETSCFQLLSIQNAGILKIHDKASSSGEHLLDIAGRTVR